MGTADGEEFSRFMADRAGRRRGAQRATCAGVAVLALLATVVVSVRGGSSQPAAVTTAGLAAGATPKALSEYRWSNLPVAPIDARTQAAIGWTGHEMVVWGGVTHEGQILADGAAFDPIRSAWRRIPAPAGVPPRYGADALWTGTELLVVGGQTAPNSDSRNGVAAAGAGGAYDPASDRWRPMAPGPADTERVLAAAWTGGVAIVLTAERSSAAYDPATDRWRSLPPLPEVSGRELQQVIPVWTGHDLLVWVLWAHADISPTTGSGTLASGIDLFSLDVAAGAWTPRPGHGAKPIGVAGAYWTGDDVVLPAADVFRGYAAGPGQVNGRHGLRYDPGTDTYTAIAHGPLDDGSSASYWTGAAILTISHGFSSGPEPIDDRDTAAWDPASDHWTRLKRAPAAVTYETPLLWTGKEFLAYGPQPTRFGR